MKRRLPVPTGDPEIDLPARRPALLPHGDDELVEAASSGDNYLGWAEPAVGFQRFVISRYRRGRLPDDTAAVFFICQSAVLGSNGLRKEAIFSVPERRSAEPWRLWGNLSPLDRLVMQLLRCRPPHDPNTPVDYRRFIGLNILGDSAWRLGRKGIIYGRLRPHQLRLATGGKELKPFDNRLLTGSSHPTSS